MAKFFALSGFALFCTFSTLSAQTDAVKDVPRELLVKELVSVHGNLPLQYNPNAMPADNAFPKDPVNPPGPFPPSPYQLQGIAIPFGTTEINFAYNANIPAMEPSFDRKVYVEIYNPWAIAWTRVYEKTFKATAISPLPDPGFTDGKLIPAYGGCIVRFGLEVTDTANNNLPISYQLSNFNYQLSYLK